MSFPPHDDVSVSNEKVPIVEAHLRKIVPEGSHEDLSNSKVPIVSVDITGTTAYVACSFPALASGQQCVFTYSSTAWEGNRTTPATEGVAVFGQNPGPGSVNPSQIVVTGLTPGSYTVTASCTVSSNGLPVGGSPFQGPSQEFVIA